MALYKLFASEFVSLIFRPLYLHGVMKRRSAWWVVWLVCFKEFLICRVSIFLGQFLYAAQSNQSYSTLIDCYNRLNSRYLGLCLSNVLCEIGCMEIADVRDGDVNTRKFGDDIFFKSLLGHFQQKHFVETVSWLWHFLKYFLIFRNIYAFLPPLLSYLVFPNVRAVTSTS